MSFSPVTGSLPGLPLGSLELIVLDTETTGLDSRNARIIELAAVRIMPGSWEFTDTFSELVNPGIPIPASSTKIHGISDRDVADSGSFAAVMGEFIDWAGCSLVIGYSVGYDISVFMNEHGRSGITWSPPRYLDVQELVQAVGMELPDWSLETVAGSMSIPVLDRHRALPDAILTARVFKTLVPMLRSAGIFTFAEAERASVAVRRRMGETDHQPTAQPAEFSGISSYAFRHRAGSVMATPPLVATETLSLGKAIGLMMEKGTGSLFITKSIGGDHGILTERDILRAIHADGAAVLAHPCGAYGSWPLATVGRKEFLYRAIIEMTSRGTSHLGVTDDDGTLIGSISARDLFTSHADDAIALGREIDAADNPAELGRVWSGLTTVARALVTEGVDARNITAIISRELRALTQRACQLAESGLEEEGGWQPADYAMIVLGSGGRGESMLAMDQDNAIIHGGAADNVTLDRQLEMLGRRVADILDAAGVRYCTGGIMASNRPWRRNLDEWQSTVTDWLARTAPEDILNADIFFDAMPVHGNAGMANALRAESIREASRARTFIHLMATNACDFKGALGWMGRLKLEGGRVDLKMRGILPIISAARAKALEHAVYARSTADRLRDVRNLNIIADNVIDDLLGAHGYLLGAILRQQIRDIERGVPLSNSVAPGEMDGSGRSQLKWALEQVPRVADLVGKPSLM